MDTAQTEKLKALALAATQGKWEVDTIKSEGEYGTDEDGGRGFMAYVVTDDKGRPLVDSLNRDESSIHVESDGDSHYAWDELAKRDCEFIAASNPATVLELIADNERLRARFEYIEDHATTQGGGNGFTITCFVPVDCEDIGCGIDAAIEKEKANA